MTNIFKILDDKGIQYSLLNGAYDEDSYAHEVVGFKKDLDLVLNCEKDDVFNFILAEDNFKYLEDNSFLDVDNDLRIDLYFKTLNVGYYHFLKIDKSDFLTKEVSEKSYIIYQILDPLLKFSKYHYRHQYRLKKYFTPAVPLGIEDSLKEIIGNKLTNELLGNISSSNFEIKNIFIQKCKLRMLFINGNFVKMIKSRIF